MCFERKKLGMEEKMWNGVDREIPCPRNCLQFQEAEWINIFEYQQGNYWNWTGVRVWSPGYGVLVL